MREFSSVIEAVKDCFGAQIEIKKRLPVSGGDINEAYCLMLSDGGRVFLKANRRESIGFFRTEAEGLRAIRSTGAIQTPELLSLGTEENRSFLLLSFVETGRPQRDFFEDFGRRLAGMHAADTESFVSGGKYGFFQDNYIGAGPQKNEPRDSWISFFREMRLFPQIERASRYFSPTEREAFEWLLSHLDQFLTEPKAPALLHGDLWGGNFMTGADGTAWLIDPAAYVGHPEADLAMTELFGGFSADFYRGYYEVSPKEPGYEIRREIYNLYHLLNHLNLFGGGYLSSVRRVLSKLHDG